MSRYNLKLLLITLTEKHTTVSYTHLDNGFWSTSFKLKDSFANNSVFPELEATGQLMMRFGANLIGNHAKLSFKNTMIRGEGKKEDVYKRQV